MANRIDIKLQSLRSAGKTALVPYVTIGFPDLDTSRTLAEVIAGSGADMLELGVPFSDPLADGPTVQMASFRALQQGVTTRVSLEVVRDLRAAGVEIPLILMGYYNPFLRYGVEDLVRDSESAGLDGFIVPDLPTEEAGPLKTLCQERGIYVVPMLAPTSTDERIEQACRDAHGFIYCVSVTGVTSARSKLSSGISGLVERIRRHTDLPVLVGFGVSNREHVEEIGRYADGAVVGSALLDAIDKSPSDRAPEAARRFVSALATADTSPL